MKIFEAILSRKPCFINSSDTLSVSLPTAQSFHRMETARIIRSADANPSQLPTAAFLPIQNSEARTSCLNCSAGLSASAIPVTVRLAQLELISHLIRHPLASTAQQGFMINFTTGATASMDWQNSICEACVAVESPSLPPVTARQAVPFQHAGPRVDRELEAPRRAGSEFKLECRRRPDSDSSHLTASGGRSRCPRRGPD